VQVSSLHLTTGLQNLRNNKTDLQFSHWMENWKKFLTEMFALPLRSVEPPDSTMFEKRVRRRSMSDFWMAKASTSWIPSLSSPIRSGLKRSSGALNRAGPICERKTAVSNTKWFTWELVSDYQCTLLQRWKKP